MCEQETVCLYTLCVLFLSPYQLSYLDLQAWQQEAHLLSQTYLYSLPLPEFWGLHWPCCLSGGYPATSHTHCEQGNRWPGVLHRRLLSTAGKQWLLPWSQLHHISDILQCDSCTWWWPGVWWQHENMVQHKDQNFPCAAAWQWSYQEGFLWQNSAKDVRKLGVGQTCVRVCPWACANFAWHALLSLASHSTWLVSKWPLAWVCTTAAAYVMHITSSRWPASDSAKLLFVRHSILVLYSTIQSVGRWVYFIPYPGLRQIFDIYSKVWSSHNSGFLRRLLSTLYYCAHTNAACVIE